MSNPTYSQVGQASSIDGIGLAQRSARQGDVTITHLHGRFYEATTRFGVIAQSPSATRSAYNSSNNTIAGLGTATTPFLSCLNPLNSPINAVLQIARVQLTVTAATATGGPPFCWVISLTGNTGVGSANSQTLTNMNSYMIDGATGNLFTMGNYARGIGPFTGDLSAISVIGGSSLGAGSALSYSFVGTAVNAQTVSYTDVENLDGSLIVPPGALIGLCSTTTGVAQSGVSSLIWEEVPK